MIYQEKGPYVREMTQDELFPQPNKDYLYVHSDREGWILDRLVLSGVEGGTLVLHAVGDAIPIVISVLARHGHYWKRTMERINPHDKLQGDPREAYFAFDVDAVGIMWYGDEESIQLESYQIAKVQSMMKICFASN